MNCVWTKKKMSELFNIIRIIGVCILGIACAGHTASIVPDAVRKYKTFETGSDIALHIFNPKAGQPEGQRPAIIFFFGGGWRTGTPKQFYQQAREFSNRGMVAISAQYRVKNTHGVSPVECVRDGKSAIRWVRMHADELGVDPERIVAAGGSAGGHVAACTALIKGYDEPGENMRISSVPNALVLYNPVVNQRNRLISPMDHVGQDLPPVIIFHGTADSRVPFRKVEQFTDLMQSRGNACILVPFEGRDHGFYNGSFFNPKNGDTDFYRVMDKSIEFLTRLGFLESR